MADTTQRMVLFTAWLLIAAPSAASAQGFGGFGSAFNTRGPEGGSREGTWRPTIDLPVLPPESALNFITVDGTAEIRVAPDGIRVVFAIISEGATADACQTKNAERVAAVSKAWNDLDIASENIVEDFINVLPIYRWRTTERDGQQYRIQRQEGHRMQTNLHVSVKTEEEAMKAINAAFQQGVTDVVTFDYWSSTLNQQKEKARKAALETAMAKSETLFSVFPQPPKVINVQESTDVFAPHSLYRTYENVLGEEVQNTSAWNDKPAIEAYRPKMTFFHGLQGRRDVEPTTAAMRPEFSVVSTVRIYYQSPADKTINTSDSSQRR